MASLIDSSVLVDIERGRTDLGVLLEKRGDRGIAMAAITAAELLHGVHRLRISKRKTRAEAVVEVLLSSMPVIPFDPVCARAHARLGAELARRGVTVGTHDLMIGATALARGFSVLTRDQRSFPRIPGLDVEGLP
ncbi:MAG TPA: PIN domain-containing protein [Myxococcota bacterium]|nr:PIN domain-containing protein [Myxococcota bacterium]